jgi:hypothetical protein
MALARLLALEAVQLSLIQKTRARPHQAASMSERLTIQV